MDKIKTITLGQNYSLLATFAAILFLTVFAPLLNNQLLTGTLVNSLLILSVFLCGFNGAILIAFLPSMISWYTGLLPMAMGPMIPFVFLANFILILIVRIFQKKNYWLAGGLAIIAKAVFLSVISYILFSFFLTGIEAKIAISMMSYMQLLTAALGLILAYGILKIMGYGHLAIKK